MVEKRSQIRNLKKQHRFKYFPNLKFQTSIYPQKILDLVFKKKISTSTYKKKQEKKKTNGRRKSKKRGLTESFLYEVVEGVTIAVVGELVVRWRELLKTLGGDAGEIPRELGVLR